MCNFCADREVILFDRYLLVKRVGEGNFSAVFLARDVWAVGDEDRVQALKIFHQQYLEIGQAVLEKFVLSILNAV
jgi:serine/threonine protein kinase